MNILKKFTWLSSVLFIVLVLSPVSGYAIDSLSPSISERTSFWNRPLFGAEKRYFNIALEENTKECYEVFLKLYPRGKLADKVKAIIADIDGGKMLQPRDVSGVGRPGGDILRKWKLFRKK